MGYQLTALVVVFFIADVTCDECKYRRFVPPDVPHIGCIPRNPDCNITDDVVTDKEKSLILELHNQIRENITLGRESRRPQVPGMPPASNMMEMVWDDELAELAQRRAETCEFHHDCYECLRVERFPVGQVLFRVWQEPSEGIWEKMLKQFYNEVGDFKRRYVSSYRLRKHFAELSQILWAETWRVGCGKVTFMEGRLNMTHVACHYGPRGNFENFPMYWIGEPCSECPDKTCCGKDCGKSSLYKGLCQAKEGYETTFHDLSPEDVAELEHPKDSKVIMCSATGSTLGETRTTGNSITCRLSNSQEWPLLDSTGEDACKYEKFTSEHIGCKPKNPSCKFVNNRVTVDEKREVMKWLNEYRDDVASGIVTIRGFVTHRSIELPPAANMNQLYWDDELAMLAQRHAETCNKDEDCPECRQTDRFNVGQIIYTSNSTDFPRQWEKMVYASIHIHRFFYQIIWAETFRVGCGKVIVEEGYFDFKTMIVCNFGPDANLMDYMKLEDAPVAYMPGFVDDEGKKHACYKCPDDFCCKSSCEDYGIRSDFKALCKSTKLEVVIPRKEECKYKKFTPRHIGCKPRNPRCKTHVSKVTTVEINRVMWLLNKYRDQLARGDVVRGSVRLPAATNMHKMYWDNELSMLAQRHAERCNKYEDCLACRETDRFNVGQIIYTSSTANFLGEWENMVLSSLEIRKYFFQIVWAVTFRVGCGIVILEDGFGSEEIFGFKTIIVCYFGPGANLTDDTNPQEDPAAYKSIEVPGIGEIFEPCSQCPDGFCCGSSCEDYGIRNDFTVLCRSINIETQKPPGDIVGATPYDGLFAYVKCRMWSEPGVHHETNPAYNKQHYTMQCRSSRP